MSDVDSNEGTIGVFKRRAQGGAIVFATSIVVSLLAGVALVLGGAFADAPEPWGVGLVGIPGATAISFAVMSGFLYPVRRAIVSAMPILGLVFLPFVIMYFLVILPSSWICRAMGWVEPA